MDKNALVFYEEAVDLLANLEGLLLDLEKNPDNPEFINDVFRTLHTLKGSGSMFGFTALAEFVHNIESTFEMVRQGRLALSSEMINLTLQARDLMKILIEQDKKVSEEEEELIGDITQAFIVIAGNYNGTGKPKISAKAASNPESGANSTAKASVVHQSEVKSESDTKETDSLPLNTWFISFAPAHDFLNTGNNPLMLLEELAGLGEVLINCNTSLVPDLESIEPEKLYLSWEILLKTNVDENAVRDVFLFVEDICDIRIQKLDDTASAGFTQTSADLETPRQPEADKEISEVLSSTSQEISSADREKAAEKPIPMVTPAVLNEAGKFDNQASGIKVDAGKLDRLIGLLGELVTIQARLSQTADNRGDAELITIAQELDALTGDLRDSALKLSMLPINSIFSRLEKLVSTKSASTGRQLAIRFRGGDTELDKGVMSKLYEPLAQLVGLCADQCMATEKTSESAPDKGHLIDFSAWHSSGNVCISIENNCTKKTGQADSAFAIIKRLIEELRGTLDHKNSPAGGSCFTIRMPLNLAIIEGLMVRLEDSLFVFPLSLVEECIELTEADQSKNYNKNVVMLRGQIIPYIKLRETFKIDGKPPEIQQVVITNVNHQRVGFTVDQVVGEYQTVIKSWGKFCSDTPGITGATILGDGTVALIADLPQLISEERHNIEKFQGELN